MTLFVASLAEAWIEIRNGLLIQRSHRVASLAEAWIEINDPASAPIGYSGRLPRGGVD